MQTQCMHVLFLYQEGKLLQAKHVTVRLLVFTTQQFNLSLLLLTKNTGRWAKRMLRAVLNSVKFSSLQKTTHVSAVEAAVL